MKKAILSIFLLSSLALSGCTDSRKPEVSQPAEQPPAASQQASQPNEGEPAESKDTEKPETAAVDTGLGITANEYQTTYNAHVEQFNTQMNKDPVRMVPLNLKINGKKFNACTMPYACLNGTMTGDGRYIHQIAISGTLTLQTPKSLALAPVHMMIGSASAIQGASIPDIKDLLDRLSDDAQKRHATSSSLVFKGYRIDFSHPKTERIVLTISKAPIK
ncbi:MAG: hypothetical protein ACI4NO_05735 [Oxalobacter sp.]